MAGRDIEGAFQTATGIVLGKKLAGLESYAGWLGRYVNSEPLEMKSAISDRKVLLCDTIFYQDVKDGAVELEESLELGRKAMNEKDLDALSLSNAAAKLKNIKYFTPEAVVGANPGVVECTLYGYSCHCFRCSALNQVEYSAYSFWPRQSKYIFGSRYVFSSNFCIKCYHSINLSRCFELLDCNNCSDSYFCHNSEGLSNCMFCFNAKGLRYAIGNVEVGKEEYGRVRKILLDAVGKRLEKDKDLKLSIYNLRV